MRLSDEMSVKKHIKGSEKYPVYLIYGDEGYLNNFYANSLASSVTDTSDVSFNYYAFDAETVTFDALYEACETLPVMSDKVCITVKDMPFDKMNNDDAKPYLDYIPKIPDTAVVIFYVTSAEINENEKWKKMLSAVEANGCVICLSKRTDKDIASLLVRSASKRNTSISPQTASYFVSVAGSDMQQLLTEFDKLCAYSGGKEITREMIDTITVRTVEASVFDITKSILAGKNDRAFELLTELFKNREDPIKILGALIMEFTDMYRAKVASENGRRVSECVAAFPNYKNKSFRLDKASRAAAGLTSEQLKKCIDAVADADIKMKSFGFNNKMILEELLARLILIAGKRK